MYPSPHGKPPATNEREYRRRKDPDHTGDKVSRRKDHPARDCDARVSLATRRVLPNERRPVFGPLLQQALFVGSVGPTGSVKIRQLALPLSTSLPCNAEPWDRVPMSAAMIMVENNFVFTISPLSGVCLHSDPDDTPHGGHVGNGKPFSSR